MQGLVLPAPTQVYETYADHQTAAPSAPLKPEPPPYGRRQGFVPRTADDFGDGGAFPEIHVAQYPLDLGRPNKSSSCSAIVPLKVGADGEVQYDGILQKGGGKTFSKFTDLVPKEFDQVRIRV
jgi:SNW domain-containing protein 1